MNEAVDARSAREQQQVLYRKWRPRRFADVAGQAPVTTTLRNAVAQRQPAHAYLFTGPRGTGKTSTGRIMAKAVNCEAPEGGEPDERCPSCLAYNEGRALDLIELDAASNRGIDEIRNLRESAAYAPSSGRYKIYLIDEVHMLTDAAFNALLKTLEEPPSHVIFILATTEPHRIPATIASRCQRFDFRRIQRPDVTGRLREIAAGEGISVDEAGLELIAREATGSLRDAVNLLDQLVAYHGPALDIEAIQSGLGLVVDTRAGELARAAVHRDLKSGLEVLAAARDDGVEIRAFMREVVTTLRSALHVKAGAGEGLGVSDAQLEDLRALAEGAAVERLVAALASFGDLDFAGDAYDSLPAEIAFAELVTTSTATAAPSAPDASAGARGSAAAEGGAPAAAKATPRGTPSRTRGDAPPRRQPAPRAEQPERPAQPGEGHSARAPAGSRDAPSAPAGSRDAPSAPEAEPRPPAFVPPDEQEAGEELQALRARWDEIRDQARKLHFRAGALLNTAYPQAAQGDRLILGFRFENHVEMLREAEGGRVMQAVRQAVSAVIGREVEVEPVHWEALQEAGPAPPRRTSGGHLGSEARRLGATPVDE